MTRISLLPDLKIQHIIQLVDYICSNRTILNHKYNERIYFYAQSSDLLVVGASSITEIAWGRLWLRDEGEVMTGFVVIRA